MKWCEREPLVDKSGDPNFFICSYKVLEWTPPVPLPNYAFVRKRLSWGLTQVQFTHMAANVPHCWPLIPALTLRHLTLSSRDMVQPLKSGANREFIPESAISHSSPGTQFLVSPNTKSQHGSSSIKIYSTKTEGIIIKTLFKYTEEGYDRQASTKRRDLCSGSHSCLSCWNLVVCVG